MRAEMEWAHKLLQAMQICPNTKLNHFDRLLILAISGFYKIKFVIPTYFHILQYLLRDSENGQSI